MARKLAPGQKLVLASHNPGKLREIEDLLRPLGIEVVSAGALGSAGAGGGRPGFRRQCPDQGAGGGNCHRAAGAVGRFRLLRCGAERRAGRALRPLGRPGQGFCPGHGRRSMNGIGDAARTGGRGSSPRLCLAWPDGHTETFLGRVDGTVVWPPRGDKGFGYDPMFVPGGGAQTFGEMDPDEKHADQPSRAGVRPGAGVLLRLMQRQKDSARSSHAGLVSDGARLG